MPREAKLLVALAVAVAAFVIANGTANRLSKPLEQSRLWRSLMG